MRRFALAFWTRLFALAIAAFAPAVLPAQPSPDLLWVTNSSVKLQQLIGEQASGAYGQDTDRETGAPLLNPTYGRYQVGGTDLGVSFEADGRLMFLFGDTLYLQSGDTMAWSASTNPADGLALTFFTNAAGNPSIPLTIQPPNVDMGSYDVPAAGISNAGNIYIVCKTGYSKTWLNTNDYSVLVRFDPRTGSFFTGRTLSALTRGGHFIDMSLCHSDTNILLFGTGYYRSSAVYLSRVPAANFESGAGAAYFAGFSNGIPRWSAVETNAVPIVTDNELNPTIGNVSVQFVPDLGLWLMTYDGNRPTSTSAGPAGIYLTYAASPTGPWSPPQLMFNAARDHGYGTFIHNRNYTPSGPAGPTIDPANNPPDTIPGGAYAPNMIGRFTTVRGNTLTLHYTLSTWNPYTIVLMKSEFSVIPRIDPGSVEAGPNHFGFSWKGPAGAAYQVQTADSLTGAWTTQGPVITSTNGTFRFTGPRKSGGPETARFFRLLTAN